MRLPAVRGVILEELVLYLLTLVGYRVINAQEEGTRVGAAGLEVQGRGEWHQIDALAAFDRTPAFMYALRLMVEAKCYALKRPVGIEVVRNAVGVLKDISENYFTYEPRTPGDDSVQAPRFNYHAAIFSASGYTSGAQKYAIAHQIFLVQYRRLALLEPVIIALLSLRPVHLAAVGKAGSERQISRAVRVRVRSLLRVAEPDEVPPVDAFTAPGQRYLVDEIINPLREIRGSYFGMLQGKWPMHLLSPHSLPAVTFEGRDVVRCKVWGREADRWSFSPVGIQEGDEGWFRLEFDLPEEIAGIVHAARQDAFALAQIKQEQFSFLDVAGKIGGVYRQVRLKLDPDWLEAYLQRIAARQRWV